MHLKLFWEGVWYRRLYMMSRKMWNSCKHKFAKYKFVHLNNFITGSSYIYSGSSQYWGYVTFWFGSRSPEANGSGSESCKFIAHLDRSLVTELREGSLLCLKMRLGKNFRTKTRSLGFGSGFESGIRIRIRIRIRNRIRNFCFGYATLLSKIYRYKGMVLT
jgi:hypothetical protein